MADNIIDTTNAIVMALNAFARSMGIDASLMFDNLDKIVKDNENHSKIASEEFFKFISESKDFFRCHGVMIPENYDSESSFIRFDIDGELNPLKATITKKNSLGENVSECAKVLGLYFMVNHESHVKMYFHRETDNKISLDYSGIALSGKIPRNNFLIAKKILIAMTKQTCTICKKLALESLDGDKLRKLEEDEAENLEIDIKRNQFTHRKCQ